MPLSWSACRRQNSWSFVSGCRAPREAPMRRDDGDRSRTKPPGRIRNAPDGNVKRTRPEINDRPRFSISWYLSPYTRDTTKDESMPLPNVGTTEIVASEHAPIVCGPGSDLQLLVPAVAYINQQYRVQIRQHRYARVGIPDFGTRFSKLTRDTPWRTGMPPSDASVAITACTYQIAFVSF